MRAMLRFLTDDGQLQGALPSVPPSSLLALHRWMLLGRTFEQRAVTLQRQGRMGVFGPIGGQEAAYAGSAAALQPEDWICPSYRDFLPMLVHGLPLTTAWFYYRGDPRGSWIPEPVNGLPFQTILATQTVHAVGLAMAARYQGKAQIAMAYHGDGATSEGDFHEALNLAGVYRAPVVFFCTNNQWAISTPRSKQTAAETIADKAAGYGIHGVLVDGMDVLAVYQATREAVERARSGGGPTLIEAVAYRMGAHSTVDDPRRYRDEAEVQAWAAKDPIKRYRRFLLDQGLMTPADEERMQAELLEQVSAAFEETWNAPPPDPRWMFDKLHVNPPPELGEQKAELLRLYRKKLAGEGA